MKKFLVALLSLLAVNAQGALSDPDKAILMSSNIVVNPGFESGTAGWVASGGTFTATSGSKGFGALGGSWDSSAAAQTLRSKQVTIPPGLQGKNAILSCAIKNAANDSTVTLGLYDGTAAFNAQTIVLSASQFVRTNVNFVAPSSGTLGVQLTSVASNESVILIDDCFIADASLANISQVSQALYFGSATYAGTTSCNWTRISNASFASFPVDSDCPTPSVDGQASAPATKIPAITFANMGPGEYDIRATGMFFASGSTQPCSFRFSDGTLSTSAGVVYGSGSPSSPVLSGHLSITSGGARTIEIQATGRDGNYACDILANTATTTPLRIEVYRFPTTSDTLVNSINSDYGWTAYTPTINGFGTVSSVSFFQRRIGENLEIRGKWTNGTVAASTASISLPSGLVIDSAKIPATQLIGDVIRGTATVNAVKRFVMTALTGTSTTVIYPAFASSDAVSPFSTANGSDMASTSEVMSIHASVPISGWVQSNRAPLLIGSVTSNSTGAERVERASVSSSCTSTPCTITSQSGSWLSSISRSATGTYTANFTAGMFSSAPSCFVLTSNNGVTINTNPTTSSFSFISVTSAGTPIDGSFMLMCMGPR